MVKISVITPSFNQGDFIEATILSVLNQSHAADEYIIMDGGSTDQTCTLLEKYRNQLQFFSEKDHGQTDALNKALKLAHYEVIGWLNSDDLYTKDALALVKAAFDADPRVDVVYGNAEFIDMTGKKIGRYPTLPVNQKNLFLDCILCQPAVFFKKNLLTRFGYLETRYHFGMDYEFWLRLFSKGVRFKYIPQVLAQQRLHQDTKTSSKRMEANKETCELIYQYAGKIPLHRALIYTKSGVMDAQKKISLTQFITLLKKNIQKYPIDLTIRGICHSFFYSIKKWL